MLEDSMLKAFLTLLACVAGLGILLFFVKKYARKTKKSSGSIDLQVLSRITLQPKSHLYVVKAGEKTLLLGAADHNISMLSDLSAEDKPPQGFNSNIKVNKELIGALKNSSPKNLSDAESDSLSFKSFLSSMLKKEN